MFRKGEGWHSLSSTQLIKTKSRISRWNNRTVIVGDLGAFFRSLESEVLHAVVEDGVLEFSSGN
jgi:hypothetical protein